jgi:probable F420-dependent oxidoreductase
MSSSRLRGIDPGRLGIFAGSLSQQPAKVQREVAAEIEKLGFGTLWYGESIGREAFAQAGIFLSATSHMVVASGIANIWARDPMAMAAGGRTLAEAWPRRFILGLGVSHAPMVAARGHDYRRPVTAMREYLDGLTQASWRGPEVELPPLVLAALGPRMVALAAERAAGAYPYFTTTEHVRQVREQLGPDAFLAADLPSSWPPTSPRRERSATRTRVSTSEPRTIGTISSVWAGRRTTSSRQARTCFSMRSSPGVTSPRFGSGSMLTSRPGPTRSSSTW